MLNRYNFSKLNKNALKFERKACYEVVIAEERLNRTNHIIVIDLIIICIGGPKQCISKFLGQIRGGDYKFEVNCISC